MGTRRRPGGGGGDTGGMENIEGPAIRAARLVIAETPEQLARFLDCAKLARRLGNTGLADYLVGFVAAQEVALAELETDLANLVGP